MSLDRAIKRDREHVATALSLSLLMVGRELEPGNAHEPGGAMEGDPFVTITLSECSRPCESTMIVATRDGLVGCIDSAEA